MIARLDAAAIADLEEAFPRFGHKPLAHLPHLTPNQRHAYWLDEIAQDLADESSIAFVARVADRIEGLALYRDSPWDTRIIGRRVGILKHLAAAEDPHHSKLLDDLITEVIRHTGSRGGECLTSKVHALDFGAIHALERHEFLLMDTLVDFVFDPSRTPLDRIDAPRRAQGVSTRLAKPEDLHGLLALSQKAYVNFFGRYHSDPTMPRGVGTRVYDEWLRSSFAGWADWILVAEVEGTIAGYGVWKKASAVEAKHSLGIAHYNLAAIHPDFSGRGLYTALALDGMRMAQSFATRLDGPVHVSNYPVHHALQKLGWRTAGARHSFHKWLQA
jgi:GNAT superfamily N-acetyltransferase